MTQITSMHLKEIDELTAKIKDMDEKTSRHSAEYFAVWFVILVAAAVVVLSITVAWRVGAGEFATKNLSLQDFSQLGGGLSGVVGSAASLASGLLFFSALLLQHSDIKRQRDAARREALLFRQANARGKLERDELQGQSQLAQSNQIVDRMLSLVQLRSSLLAEKRMSVAAGKGSETTSAFELNSEINRIDNALKFHLKSPLLADDTRVILSSLIE